MKAPAAIEGIPGLGRGDSCAPRPKDARLRAGTAPGYRPATMQMRRFGLFTASTVVWLLVGCPSDDTGQEGTETGNDSGSGTSADSGSGTGADCVPSDQEVPPLDLSACMADANDYQPTVNGSADDAWPECVNDDGGYTPFEQPGAAARTEAWEMIRSIFAAGTTPEDFTMARTQYALDEGIESRTLRREDIHYPNIDEADQDPMIDFDKQCTIETNVEKYPDRCAGPAKIAPIINAAFVAGQAGEGNPAVHAARIDAAIEWFMYLSVVKEAIFSCPPADYGGDCDAAWGYYNGATERGNPLGFGADVAALSPQSNERIFDGLAAMRCWRDAYAPDADADTTDPLYGYGSAQLDRAATQGVAVILRDRLSQQLACGDDPEASWAYIQVLGQAIIKPAQDADATQAATWEALIANDAPTAEEILAGAAALDALFPCP